MSRPTLSELHGLGPDDEDLQSESLWQTGPFDGSLRIPIGVDQNGATVALDFSRLRSLDDHMLIVGNPAAGTTALLRILAAGTCVMHPPQNVSVLVVEGKPDAQEYAEVAQTPHCRGHVKVANGQEKWLARRLMQVLAGVTDRRRELLKTTGFPTIEAYREAAKTADLPEPLPEVLVIIDNLTWLHGDDFDKAIQLLTTDGHRLGLRMVVGAPFPLWENLNSTGYFDKFTARAALGLPRHHAAAVLGTDVPEDLDDRADAYINHLGGQPTRAKIAYLD